MKENISEYKFSMFSIIMLWPGEERKGLANESKLEFPKRLTVPIADGVAVGDASSQTGPVPRKSWAERRITASWSR